MNTILRIFIVFFIFAMGFGSSGFVFGEKVTIYGIQLETSEATVQKIGLDGAVIVLIVKDKKGETQTYNIASPAKLRDAFNRPIHWQSVKKGNRATIYHELNVDATLSPFEPISHIIFRR